jgi:hypothetical protein
MRYSLSDIRTVRVKYCLTDTQGEVASSHVFVASPRSYAMNGHFCTLRSRCPGKTDILCYVCDSLHTFCLSLKNSAGKIPDK